MYEPVSPGAPLTQGDLIDDCPIAVLDPGQTPDDSDPDFRRFRERVIVLTQACDLAQSKTTRAVVAVVQEAEQLVEQGLLTPKQIRENVRNHRFFGWYFLPESSAGVTLPESIVDLRNLHTVPTSHLQGLADQGRRVGRLLTPYREHLARHFAETYSRIALPEPYETTP